MKKIASVFLAAVLALSFSTLAFAEQGAGENTIKFGSDGKFKIMYICDVQDSYPLNDGTLAFIGEALDEAKPDIAILGGDNIMSGDVRGYDQLLSLFTERNVPFSFVFGNHDHDSDSKPTKEEQLLIYQSYDGCLAYDADPSLSGCATHNLTIKSSDGERAAFNLWLFDSGDYCTYDDGERDYDRVRRDQIEWYIEKSIELQQANGGQKVPSLAFQHIIVPEVYEALFIKSPFRLNKLTKNFADGSSYLYIPNLIKLNGMMFEAPCPSYGNDGEWDTFVERGDVLGCAFGHDHINSFVVKYRGVDLIQTPGSSFRSYGKDIIRGVRLLTIDENDPWSYETEVLTAAELAQKDGSKIPEITGKSAFRYSFFSILSKILFFIMEL
jgi:predicted MPP superfamily phosphohydrolase